MPKTPLLPYMGNLEVVDTWLENKTGYVWAVPQYLNGFFRSFSQVLFVNNPVSGILILAALIWANPMVGAAGVLTTAVAMFTSHLFYQEGVAIRSGLTAFNAVLVGTVPIGLWETVTGGAPIPGRLWLVLIAGAVFSVFLTNALHNMLSSFKVPLPCLTMPFNIIALLIFTCFVARPYAPALRPAMVVGNDTAVRVVRQVLESTVAPVQADTPIVAVPAVNGTYVEVDPTLYNWGRILEGVFLSMGQVFGVRDTISSIAIFIAVLIYSPTMCFMSLIGSSVGNLAGLIFTGAPYLSVYHGLWGFNGILSAAAVGGYFLVMTAHSFFLAVLNVLFTVGIQQALLVAFRDHGMPVFTLPFVISTLIFLSFTSRVGLPRVTKFTFPELHRQEYMERMGLTDLHKGDIEESPEEKELVLKDVKVTAEGGTVIEEKEKPALVTAEVTEETKVETA